MLPGPAPTSEQRETIPNCSVCVNRLLAHLSCNANASNVECLNGILVSFPNLPQDLGLMYPHILQQYWTSGGGPDAQLQEYTEEEVLQLSR